MASTSRKTLDLDAGAAPTIHPPLSYRETVEIVTKFIEVAIHSILCIRDVYPRQAFSSKKRYETKVWQSRHPGLNTYIAGAIDAVGKQLLKQTIQNVVLLVMERSTSRVLERFVFRLDQVIPVPEDRNLGLDIKNNLTKPEVELHLRGMMNKIMAMDGRMSPYNDISDVTCAIVIEVKEGLKPVSDDINEASEGPWVPLDPAAQRAARDAKTDPLERKGFPPEAYTLPVKTLNTGVINLLVYAEEHVSHKQSSSQEDDPLRGATQAASSSLAAAEQIVTPAPSRRAGKGKAVLAENTPDALAQSQRAPRPARPAGPIWRDSERDIDDYARGAHNSASEEDADGGQGAGKKVHKRRKRRRARLGGDGDRSRVYGAAMGVRTGGGVQNAADIGDDDAADLSSETESDDSSQASAGKRGAAGSDNDMTSIAGMGFGGPSKPSTRKGW